MTQGDKELLLKDLCARLPYGVKVWYKYYPTNIIEKFATSIRLADDKLALSTKINKEGDWYPIEEAKEILIKPYLRPMSSMTEEEFYEFDYFKFQYEHDCCNRIIAEIDWLNAHHFDYRGLIEKGLALPAPKGMYNIKEK